MVLLILGTDTTGHGTVFRQGVTYTEAHHSILVSGSFWQFAQVLADYHESITVVEIITVDDQEGLLDHILAHEHCMVGSPWLDTSFRNAESLGQRIQSLEAQLTGNLILIFRQDLGTELLFEVLADDPYHLTESGLDGVVDTIVHDGLAVWSQTIELLQSAITASHASSEQKKSRFHLLLLFICCIVAAKVIHFGQNLPSPFRINIH